MKHITVVHILIFVIIFVIIEDIVVLKTLPKSTWN